MTERGKLKDKAIVYAGLGPDGKQRQRTRVVYADTQQKLAQAVEAARVAMRAEIEEGAQWKGTVAELAEEWMAAKARTHADTTRYANRVMVNRIIKDLGRIPLQRLTAKDLDRFYSSLLDGGLSASTANHYHRVIHAMLRQAHKWGSVPGNVADLASPPAKGSTEDLGMPTPAALRALLMNAPHNVRIAALIAAATGCRRGEVVGLRWSDIDGNRLSVRRALVEVPKQPLKVKAPKSGKGRELTLDDDFLGVLLDHRMWLAGECAKTQQRETATGWTCTGPALLADGPILANLKQHPAGGQPFTPGWLTHRWVALCEAANVDFRFHSLRHFHASELIGRGIPVSTVSKRMGHSKVSTTLDIYTRALPAVDGDAADAIGAAMRG